MRSADERTKTRLCLLQLELSHLRAAEQHWNNAQKAYEADDEKKAKIQEYRARAAESRVRRCRVKHEMLDLEEDVGGGDELNRISRMSNLLRNTRNKFTRQVTNPLTRALGLDKLNLIEPILQDLMS